MQLIIVERDPLAQGWWRTLLEETSHSLLFADDVFVAAAIVRSTAPGDEVHGIIVDAELVVEAGKAAWRQLRQLRSRHQVSLQVYTSSSRFDALAQLLGREVDGFLRRPFGYPELLRALRQQGDAEARVSLSGFDLATLTASF